MKTLYVSDLDGTLLGPDARLSDYTATTLNRLIEGGLCFSYATARSLSSASIVTQGLSAELPVILYNGAFTRNAQSGAVLDSVHFGAALTAEVSESLLRYRVYPLVYAHIGGVERVSHFAGHETDGIRAYLDARPGDARFRAVSTEAELFEGDVFYFSCIDGRAQLARCHDHFAGDDRFNCLFQPDIYNPAEHWLELMPKAATKGNAILRLKSLLGCDRIVSFGDGLNDMPMFAISDECYAVENAVDELKRAATAVIPSNREDGVAHFLVERHNLRS